MKSKQVSAFAFIEQVIAKALVQKEGKRLKSNREENYELIANPFVFESEL